MVAGQRRRRDFRFDCPLQNGRSWGNSNAAICVPSHCSTPFPAAIQACIRVSTRTTGGWLNNGKTRIGTAPVPSDRPGQPAYRDRVPTCARSTPSSGIPPADTADTARSRDTGQGVCPTSMRKQYRYIFSNSRFVQLYPWCTPPTGRSVTCDNRASEFRGVLCSGQMACESMRWSASA